MRIRHDHPQMPPSAIPETLSNMLCCDRRIDALIMGVARLMNICACSMSVIAQFVQPPT